MTLDFGMVPAGAVKLAVILSPSLYNLEGLPASPFRTDDWAKYTERLRSLRRVRTRSLLQRPLGRVPSGGARCWRGV